MPPLPGGPLVTSLSQLKVGSKFCGRWIGLRSPMMEHGDEEGEQLPLTK